MKPIADEIRKQLSCSQLSENEKEDIVIQAMKLITELKKANEFWKAEKIELRKIKKH